MFDNHISIMSVSAAALQIDCGSGSTFNTDQLFCYSGTTNYFKLFEFPLLTSSPILEWKSRSESRLTMAVFIHMCQCVCLRVTGEFWVCLTALACDLSVIDISSHFSN